MQYDDQYEQSYEETPCHAGEAGCSPEDADEMDTRQWALMLHLSQFAGYVVPVLGLIVPVLIWQMKKDTLPGLDVHGRNVMNWMLSEFIYIIISILLIVVVIGIPMLIALGLLGVVFPIIGAIKASDGVAWRYPLSIRFF